MVRYVAGHCGQRVSPPPSLHGWLPPCPPTAPISPPQLLLRRPTKQSNPPFPVVSSFRFVFCVWTVRIFQTNELCVYPGGATALSIEAPDSKQPPRPFCSVCGYHGLYTCTRCGSRFCSLKCSEQHKETRCLKFAS